MKSNKLDEIDRAIIKMLTLNEQPSNRAQYVGISQSALSHRVSNLKAKGYIVKDPRTQASTIPQAVLNALNFSKPMDYRIHDLWLTFELKDSVGNDTTKIFLDKKLSLKPLPLINHTDSYFVMDGYEGRLNPNSLELHLKDLNNLPLDADLRQAVLGLFDKIESTLLKWESQLGIKVKRIDKETLVAKISQLHIALTNHKFAETVNEKGEKLYVYVDGELRVIVDKSHGLHEYEAINAKHAIDDAGKLGKLTKGTITGAFDYEKDHELIHTAILAITKLTDKLDFYATNEVTHVKHLQNIDEKTEEDRKLLKQIVTKLNQRRLGDWL